jgi:hypothetical protein
MGKRPHDDDMDMETIRREISTLNNRMTEVLTILGGSAAYDVRGMRADVKDLKNDVIQIKNEMEKIKREATDRESRRNFLNLKTVPQKVAGFVAFLAVILTMIQSIRALFTVQP